MPDNGGEQPHADRSPRRRRRAEANDQAAEGYTWMVAKENIFPRSLCLNLSLASETFFLVFSISKKGKVSRTYFIINFYYLVRPLYLERMRIQICVMRFAETTTSRLHTTKKWPLRQAVCKWDRLNYFSSVVFAEYNFRMLYSPSWKFDLNERNKHMDTSKIIF